MKKTLSIAKMEVRFITKQGWAALLILLYPVLLMAVLGPAFSSRDFGKVDIAVFSENMEDTAKLIPSNSRINVIPAKSEADAKSRVLLGKAMLGVYITKQQSGRYRLVIYADPTKYAIATEIVIRIQAGLAQENKDFVENNIVKIWEGLSKTRTQLGEKKNEIPKLRESIQESNSSLQQMREKMKTIHIALLSDMIAESKNGTEEMGEELSNAKTEMADYEKEATQLFNSMNSKLTDADGKLVSSRAKLNEVETKSDYWITEINRDMTEVDSKDQAILAYVTTLQNLKTGNTETDKPLNDAQIVLEDTRSKLGMIRADLIKARNDLKDIKIEATNGKTEIDVMRAEIASSKTEMTGAKSRNDAKFAELKLKIDSAESKMRSTNANLDKASAELKNADDAISEADSFMADSMAKMEELDKELLDTQDLFDETFRNMDAFLEKNPMEMVFPEIVRKEAIEGLRYIDLLFPAIIGVVSMLSCLLLPPLMTVRQRNQGAKMRMKVAGVPAYSRILGKFLGNYSLGLLQVVAIVLISMIFFQIRIAGNFLFFSLAIMLIPAVFIALGVLLSGFIRNESTAVMSSLLISIPMIFLSGIALPIEFIQGYLKDVGIATPLYQSASLVTDVAIRNDAVEGFMTNGIVLIAYITIALGIAYFLETRDEE